jgi:hypothetical protein
MLTNPILMVTLTPRGLSRHLAKQLLDQAPNKYASPYETTHVDEIYSRQETTPVFGEQALRSEVTDH